MGLMFVVDRKYYDVLDTYSRNTVGMLSSNGTVFVATSTEVVLLDEYICSLSEELTGRCLEILPVGFTWTLNIRKSQTFFPKDHNHWRMRLCQWREYVHMSNQQLPEENAIFYGVSSFDMLNLWGMPKNKICQEWSYSKAVCRRWRKAGLVNAFTDIILNWPC